MNYKITDIKELIIRTKRDHAEYLKQQEISITHRESLIANIKLMTNLATEKREISEATMKLFFEERKTLRTSAEKSLDKAIEIGDADIANVILKFIEIVYENDPFTLLNSLS